jgi:hypothetical protein
MKKLVFVVPVVAVLIVVGLTAYWHISAPQRICASCHEIRTSHDTWSQSSHRGALCTDCHGTSLSNGLHSLRQNARRLLVHFSRLPTENIRLSEDQVVQMLARCKRCHEREYAGWLASGHSASYADIFLNEGHNRTEQIMDDCLRCHGMFFDGTVKEIVAPLNLTGPWKIIRPELANHPAIPCLACHRIHLKGRLAGAPDHAQPRMILYRQSFEIQRPSFYDRREKTFFDTSLLPQPAVQDGARAIAMANDARQRLCYQCHAPGADHQAGTGDDRTPRGVHEGLSCLACHAPHSMEVRRSCADCHPRLSNCGLDVEKMDTTYAKADSQHNIHTVACANCHIKGVPPRKVRS